MTTPSLPPQYSGLSAHPETRCFCDDECEQYWREEHASEIPANPSPNGDDTCLYCGKPNPPRAESYSYMLMNPKSSLNYLGFGAYVHESYKGWFIVAIPSKHAQWLSSRLITGMAGGWRIYSTLDDVRTMANQNPSPNL